MGVKGAFWPLLKTHETQDPAGRYADKRLVVDGQQLLRRAVSCNTTTNSTTHSPNDGRRPGPRQWQQQRWRVHGLPASSRLRSCTTATPLC